jgi:small conductance mechanosensitive channel
MNRHLHLILLLLFGLWGGAAFAQSVTVPVQTAPAASPAPADVKQLIQTLNDPVARARLIAQLNVLLDSQAKAKKPETEALGARLLAFLSDQVHQAGDEFRALGESFAGLPSAERWMTRQMADPTTRSHWADLAESLAMVLASGAIAIWIAMFATRAPRKSIERHRNATVMTRMMFASLRLLLALATIGIYGIVSYAVLSVTNPPAVVNIAAITIVNATILVMGILALSKFLFSPTAPALRLIAIDDATARSFNRWICWIGAILAFGWFGISAARVLGLPQVAAQAAFKIVGIAVAVLLISLIFQKRRTVAHWIAGEVKGQESGGKKLPEGHFWSVRRRMAEIWHILAAVYLVIIFAIWALDLKGGFDFVLRGTLISVAVIAVARFALALADRMADRGIELSRAAKDRFPHLQQRADRYVPILHTLTVAIIWIAGFLCLIDIWDIGSFDWFQTAAGRALIGRIVSVGFVVVSATVAWELVSAIIERYLVGAVRDGSAIERSQRVRTLLPLLHNAFLIFLIVVVVLIVLSEIGLNIAPLLAGAGVIGLAIGFGAQTLVKDVITGVFILFENTIAVGDVIDLGGGHSGLVEAFSIRTVKLRDSSGGVHTVPFSNVTTVVNLTKDFAFYMFNIKVDYAQDTDRIVDIVTALGAELQADAAYADLILAPIEIIGVDSFGSDALTLQARFKTRPIKQWTVGREFNRRLKKKFDEQKIPLSFPQSMVLSADGLAVQVKGERAAT